MQLRAALSDFANHLQRIIHAQPATLPDHQFTELALELFGLQRELNEPYGKLCKARGISQNSKMRNWIEIPAVPTPAFKGLELSCLPTKDRTAVFHSSGTTEDRPSRHFHNAESLAVYEASLIAWFRNHFQANRPVPVISLTPPREAAPHSSLVYMFESVRRKFGDDHSAFVGQVAENGGWNVNAEAAVETLQESVERGRPIVILGTAFSYVHLLDSLIARDMTFKLPAGSRVMETGGYKGRSRALPKDELHQLICERLGILPANIICEYGMSELSSQAYDNNPEGIAASSPGLRGTSYPGFKAFKVHNPERVPSDFRRVLYFPPWTRVQIISPETGREVNQGETGLIRVFDLANVFSVMAIQTEDLGIRRGSGFELLGRAALAEARGCSLMAK